MEAWYSFPGFGSISIFSFCETPERVCGLENVPTAPYSTQWQVVNGWNFSSVWTIPLITAKYCTPKRFLIYTPVISLAPPSSSCPCHLLITSQSCSASRHIKLNRETARGRWPCCWQEHWEKRSNRCQQTQRRLLVCVCVCTEFRSRSNDSIL